MFVVITEFNTINKLFFDTQKKKITVIKRDMKFFLKIASMIMHYYEYTINNLFSIYRKENFLP